MGKPPPQTTRQAYEFSEKDRDSLGALAASASFVGVCLMLAGMLMGVFAMGALYAGFTYGGIGLVGAAATSVVEAWWTMSAGRSFSALVSTRGRDVDHLMAAAAQLRRLFGFARVVIIACAVLGAAAATGFFWCNVAADRGGRCPAGFWR